MILDRQTPLSLADITQALLMLRDSVPQIDTPRSEEDVVQFSRDFENLMQGYRGAMHEISTKLEILDDEYQTRYSHNPIHHMERRMKSVKSIAGKLAAHHHALTIADIEANVFDVAGIRVMCNYIDDVYAIASMLSRQSDIRILEVKDYIKHPKESGYRSLHVIYSVPVFLTTGAKDIPVEVQFRTISMDYWASLEHRLRYKSSSDPERVARHAQTLQDAARDLYDIDVKLQNVHRDLVSAPRAAELE
ncbi:GTP pyrophosphokinase [Alloscardovia macacae]|uniref:GTP pyrophosphokinase n=1 Tax=Alloscardovia macacae TaxID=1160091 RepID=A0A1Y2SW81_9BIFI|nr:GTP pyrophosphokinase [Alloscardovia macacae]OTA25782.1 GTP pyrophosphokinase [Alloscardovia macacae]OTA28532.1 GTP pyrophosphokinase [Alloscardovia macacae]OZG54311.1 GTP pyrophosphokinase [Alloscardovia macacae]